MTISSAVIFRILGNENPPRDYPGRREQALRHILTAESNFPAVTKWYFLNRIFDRTYRRHLCEVLDQHNAHYVTVDFPRQSPTNIEALKVHGVGLNQARNLAIDLGAKLARYTAVLDGDCFFEQDGWAPIAEEVAQDKHQYLSIPFRRAKNQPCGEPQLMFRNDSEMRFDETLPFGHADKLELLYRLGHDQTPLSGHLKINGNLTRLVGEVQHYCTGNERLEHSLVERERQRNLSMQQFLSCVRHWPRLEIRLMNVPKAIEPIEHYDFFANLVADASDNCRVLTTNTHKAVQLATWFRAAGKRVTVESSELQQGATAASGLVVAATGADVDILILNDGNDVVTLQTEYSKVRAGGIAIGCNYSLVCGEILTWFAHKPFEYLPQANIWKSVKYGIENPAERKRRWY